MYNLREITEKSNIAGFFNGRVLFNEKIGPKTSFKIGGAAPLFVEPADLSSLQKILSFFRENQIPYFILGGGTNLVVSDRGFEGAVIATQGLNSVEIEKTEEKCVFVKAGAGCSMSRLVSFCTEHNLSGIEPFAGLPGTAGGALFMNARCFDLSVSDVLAGAEYLDSEYLKNQYVFSSADWDYKKSPFTQQDRIITSATFRLFQLDEAQHHSIEEKCAAYIKQRVEKGHFKFPCAGSVFKNNRAFGEPVGKIIDSLGLKGYSIGGAQIAPWHGNIIINSGNATQTEVLELTNYIRKIVFQEKGFELEPEIIFCGK